MGFRIKTRENVNFDTPQEMYKDNKKRKINGPLDYQSKMIDQYMEKDVINKKDIAIELPTGSGKTLIGLLIGEYRRRKNKEKVVYLCPNNQLVYQVVDRATNVYGIKVHGFTGSIRNYNPDSVSAYNRAETIAITNYSSLFNNNSFFSDADIILLDDAHSCENYIASVWSLEISRTKHVELYCSMVENLKDVLEETLYNRMVNNNPMAQDIYWCDKLPNVQFIGKANELSPIIEEYVQETNLWYSWEKIKHNLHACNMYLSWGGILIRPYIPPTLTHHPFEQAKQRIYMSATLGKSGELERITGVKNIKRLKMVAEWDKKSIGRRFFIFPNASFSHEMNMEVLLMIKKMTNRMLVLVQDDNRVKSLQKIFNDNTNSEVFSSRDIEKSTDEFVKSQDGVAILANRYDGIDLDGDKCNMLIIGDLPSATHLQEKFITSRMAASVLFNERIRTRIIQAIGRCTRSDVDYAAVCIFGNELENSLISPKKITHYHPELRAELDFGYEQSTNHDSIDSFLGLLKLFFERGPEWEEAEAQIINMRDEIIESNTLNIESKDFEKLRLSSAHEVEYQYALWKEDYEEALKQVDIIISILSGDTLKGYKGFWNYMGGYIANQIYKKGLDNYYEVSRSYFKEASNSTKSINWFNKILDRREVNITQHNDLGIVDVIERIELQIVRDGIKHSGNFERKAKEILELLKSDDGNDFERGHKELGTLLGYHSDNSNGQADPDPWWILNDKLCIVSEDKIYKEEIKKIPVKHVRQAITHENWIRDKIDILKRDAIIETIMITNADKIEEAASIHGKNIWYINRDEYVNWARKAIEAIRKLRRCFLESGDLLWRIEAEKILNEEQVSPLDYLEFIKKKRLSELIKNE
ncbi:DEAD/DEAH box helicase family protein [Desulfuribacillus alkaliarsenatis]|uniref:Helicase ATP-binding domain-containing protein n=1 Tax=Desulfuribacillus alkaliarsenatis TaxID=766136 RepID=A0A1E5G3W5_9FIRM|nr:DEAD/DEAH box helicase family protein [Desulfuribacillus alkaliarsenatis]OEF97770.1 hypothetical protein BHF68_13860 [Desulfuribacillus alkaliarsenatis]